MFPSDASPLIKVDIDLGRGIPPGTDWAIASRVVRSAEP